AAGPQPEMWRRSAEERLSNQRCRTPSSQYPNATTSGRHWRSRGFGTRSCLSNRPSPHTAFWTPKRLTTLSSHSPTTPTSSLRTLRDTLAELAPWPSPWLKEWHLGLMRSTTSAGLGSLTILAWWLYLPLSWTGQKTV